MSCTAGGRVSITACAAGGPQRRLLRLDRTAADSLLLLDHAFRSVASYLAAPTDQSLARLPLVTGGRFSLEGKASSGRAGAESDLTRFARNS